MTMPRNLVSDSALLQDVVDMLRVCGGRAPVERIAELTFGLPCLDAPTAALLVAELIKDDWRLRLVEQRTVELTCEDAETRALSELEFVVVDVETTDARMPPGRITEIGAYRISGGAIVAEFKSLINPDTSIPSFIVGLTG